MTQPTSMGNDILSQIREGMTVYDNEGEEVGEVETVYLGAAREPGVEPATPSVPDQGPFDQNLVDEVLDPEEEMPDVIVQRLLRNGFVKIDSESLFGADRYVMPDQLASVSNEEVHLLVSEEELAQEQ